jgi:hypothetical protein
MRNITEQVEVHQACCYLTLGVIWVPAEAHISIARNILRENNVSELGIVHNVVPVSTTGVGQSEKVVTG